MSSTPNDGPSIVVNKVQIQWNGEGRGFSFFGRDSIIFWKKPSLVSILEPLRLELGDEYYSLIIAYEASKGTYEDHHAMISALGPSFEEGFLNWGKAVSAAGWGSFSILSIDWKKREALIQIDNPWEMEIYKAEHPNYNVPFLSGKISGIFSYEFKTNCRCVVISHCSALETTNRVVLKVYPSTETLESALTAIQKQRSRSKVKQLRMMNSILRSNQQRMMDLANSFSVFIWESEENLVIRHATPGLASILGISEDEVLGTSLLELLHSEDRDVFKDKLDELRAGHHPFIKLQIRIKANHDKFVWIALFVKRSYDLSGNHSGYLGSGRDITSQIQLETQLAEQRLKSTQASKMAALGEMAAGIAHEINNPLSVIIATAWQLSQSIEQGRFNPENAKATLFEIQETSKRIANIIKGMRNFARSGEMDPFIGYSLSALVEETLVYCRARFRNHQIDFRISNSGRDFQIECRPVQISQILLNLLNNAFDAILPLSERWIELRMEDRQDFVEIRIIDSGRGISKELHHKIMLPFFTTKAPGKGTGLGLGISLSIAESHGGSLALDTQCTNTCFVLTLPKRRL